MKAHDLILRCLAQKKDGKWQAICLDLTLAAEADTLEQARRKLNEQMVHYLADALIGPDKAFASQLLSRKAPLRYWLKYYFVKTRIAFHAIKSQTAKVIDCPIPMTPTLPA